MKIQLIYAGILAACLSWPLEGSGQDFEATGNNPESNPKLDSLVFQDKSTLPRPSLDHYLKGLKHTYNETSLAYLSAATGLGLAIRPFEKEISAAFGKQDKDLLSKAPDKFGGTLTVVGASLLTYLLGNITKNPQLTNTGLVLLEAVATTQVLTLAIKHLANRARPNGENDYSFPSGHASGMFTAAAVVDARYGWKAGMPAYLVAGFVGYSRIRMQKHFPTDVIAGAALGTIMGRSFAQAHSRSSSHAIIPTLGSHLAMIQFVITFK
jgi:hypothetical protein